MSKQVSIFVIAVGKNGKFACSTRPYDKRKNDDDFGLPGGKLDAGESMEASAYRECEEEGWIMFDINMKNIFTIETDKYNNDRALDFFKEKNLI